MKKSDSPDDASASRMIDAKIEGLGDWRADTLRRILQISVEAGGGPIPLQVAAKPDAAND